MPKGVGYPKTGSKTKKMAKKKNKMKMGMAKRGRR